MRWEGPAQQPALLAGLGEEPTDPRGLKLLGSALGFRVGRGAGGDGVRRRAGVQERPAEIAGQRRSKRGRMSREAGVVLGQSRQALGRWPVLGAEQLLAGL